MNGVRKGFAPARTRSRTHLVETWMATVERSIVETQNTEVPLEQYKIIVETFKVSDLELFSADRSSSSALEPCSTNGHYLSTSGSSLRSPRRSDRRTSNRWTCPLSSTTRRTRLSLQTITALHRWNISTLCGDHSSEINPREHNETDGCSHRDRQCVQCLSRVIRRACGIAASKSDLWSTTRFSTSSTRYCHSWQWADATTDGSQICAAGREQPAENLQWETAVGSRFPRQIEGSSDQVSPFDSNWVPLCSLASSGTLGTFRWQSTTLWTTNRSSQSRTLADECD